MKRFFIIWLLCTGSLCVSAQSPLIQPRWLHGFWTAHWIAEPKSSGSQFGVYQFRKTFALDSAGQHFVIHVSADNHYRLFINGRYLANGPARSDLSNWNFETYDLAPFLHAGNNTLAVTVWNFGDFRPYSQISFQTALIVQGNTAREDVVNTGKSWKVLRDAGYRPLPIDRGQMQAYFVTAEGEELDFRLHPEKVEQPSFNDASWVSAQELWYPAKARSFGTDGNWQLVPRTIPLAEEYVQYFQKVVTPGFTSELSKLGTDGTCSLTIPAGKKVSLLIDQTFLTNAYPHVEFSGGKDAQITLSYAEALFDAQRNKGHRDSTAGKTLIGLSDRFIASGTAEQEYTPLYFRTFRYIQVEIETKQEPLHLTRFYSVFTGYPFKQAGEFSADQPYLQKIWSTGWRTARLCAVDTYFDCPYYEQLQYVGDTRIQALISLYISGDDRLMRKAIEDIFHSFIPDGLTQSRYPSRDLQVIPTFSLWWVCMLQDYWMHRTDDAFIKKHLRGVQQVLQWYAERLKPDGMLGPLSWWPFTDWSWPYVDSIRVGGVPPGASKGGSSILSLQYAYTLQRAAQLMRHYGDAKSAEHYEKQAAFICAQTYRQCWDPQRGLLADVPDKSSYSQHANILGILTDALPANVQKNVLTNLLKDTTLTQATYYFRFYLFEALKKTGQGDLFLDLLKPWQAMLDRGLTTFAEQDDPTRSDCHAWSASPNYELLSLVCGVNPLKPGFREVAIEPSLGTLLQVHGTVPTQQGLIKVNLKRSGNQLEGNVELPPGVSGLFLWKGKRLPLRPGTQPVRL